MSSYLLIKRLILVGFRKNYITVFNSGVNLIYGDSDTGKSSILEFINYLLGSNHIELGEEVISSVKYVSLEVYINDSPYTITRDIHNNKSFIEVSQCLFDEKVNHYPKVYSPNFANKNAPDGFYSDFLLDTLNFPKIKTKDSPSQDISSLKRLSFRRLFEYCYLNQDNVGSASFLNLGNWTRNVDTKEVFKYIFNVLDSNISELELDISGKTQEKNKTKNTYDTITQFFKDTNYQNLSEIENEIDTIDSDLDALQEELKTLNTTMVASSTNYQEIKDMLSNVSMLEKTTTSDIKKAESAIDNYSRLRNDYTNDINKLNLTATTKNRIGQQHKSINICPICDSNFSIEDEKNPFQNAISTSIEYEIKTLTRRKKNIQDLIENHIQKHQRLSIKLQEHRNDINKLRQMLDTETSDLVSPYLTQRDNLIKEIASKSQARENHLQCFKIRNKQLEISDKYIKLTNDIHALKKQLGELQNDAPKLDSILFKIGINLDNYLKKISIPNRHSISISPKTFAPIIRGKDYLNVTSGGLRTISSIGYLLSLFQYSIFNDIYYPRLLMIDTVGKYLGKKTKEKYLSETDQKEDIKEGLSDPEKYRNIYEYIIDLAQTAEESGITCQMILVDNDVPDNFIERYKGFIIAQFDSTGFDGLPKGLIDDIYVS